MKKSKSRKNSPRSLPLQNDSNSSQESQDTASRNKTAEDTTSQNKTAEISVDASQNKAPKISHDDSFEDASYEKDQESSNNSYKIDRESSTVTLIEDPFGITLQEISDAQNNPEELDLDSELLEQTPEEINEEFKKLAHAVAQEQAIQDLSNEIQSFEENQEARAEAELASQIADDQALQKELAEQLEVEPDGNPKSIELDASEIQSSIEALLFMADKPLTLEKLRDYLGPDFEMSRFEEAIQNLRERYQQVHHGIELVDIAGGFQLRTKPGRSNLAQKLVKVQTQKLSSGSMETLAIISYKQPVMKEDIDKIRGVDSSYFIRGLMDRKLIKISGRSEMPGRPLLYSTTPEFLEIFGLKELSSMPSLREIEQMIPSSQTRNPEDEDPRVREMRRLVGEMKADKSSALHYNPKEDEKILKEIRERVSAIPASTPYLDELKAAEVLAQQQAKQASLSDEESAQEPENT